MCRSRHRPFGHEGDVRIHEMFLDEEDDETQVSQMSTPFRIRICINVSIFTRPPQFHLDSGSSVSIVEREVFQKNFINDAKIIPPPVTQLNYSRQRIEVLGVLSATVTFKEHSARFVFYVANTRTLFLGMEAVKALNLLIQGLAMSCLYTEAVNLTNLRIEL